MKKKINKLIPEKEIKKGKRLVDKVINDWITRCEKVEARILKHPTVVNRLEGMVEEMKTECCPHELVFNGAVCLIADLEEEGIITFKK